MVKCWNGVPINNFPCRKYIRYLIENKYATYYSLLIGVFSRIITYILLCVYQFINGNIFLYTMFGIYIQINYLSISDVFLSVWSPGISVLFTYRQHQDSRSDSYHWPDNELVLV